MELTTYPLNDTDYSAEDAELYHCTRSSGIYATDSFEYSVTGADCNIAIDTGIGWIQNSKFSGKVIALKEATTLDLGLSDAVYPRIDAVIIRFDATANKTEIVVKNGVAASSPIAPEVIRTESQYELHLYHVRRSAGSAVITASDITDLRKDAKYCGLMADSVTRVEVDGLGVNSSGAITAPLILKEGVHFGDSPPEGAAEGTLFFIPVEEDT